MRVLFSAFPQRGHVHPLIPLAHAARARGDEAVMMTSAEFEAEVAPLPLFGVGPLFSELVAEMNRRTGTTNRYAMNPDHYGTLFGDVRVVATVDAALDAARRYTPDVVVADREDAVGPLVAASLGVPWMRCLLGAELPPAVTAATEQQAALRHTERGLQPVEALATFDPWPESLQPAGWVPRAGRIPVRPVPFGEWETHDIRPAGHRVRPQVLVTPGTNVRHPEIVAATVASITALDLDIDLVLTGYEGEPWPIEFGPRVRQVGFVPLAELLGEADAVVAAGGSGTVTAVLGRGLPMVVCPVGFDQFSNAELAAASGAAIHAPTPADAGPALRQLLGDSAYGCAARRVAAEIATMDPPSLAWERARERLAVAAR